MSTPVLELTEESLVEALRAAGHALHTGALFPCFFEPDQRREGMRELTRMLLRLVSTGEVVRVRGCDRRDPSHVAIRNPDINMAQWQYTLPDVVAGWQRFHEGLEAARDRLDEQCQTLNEALAEANGRGKFFASVVRSNVKGTFRTSLAEGEVQAQAVCMDPAAIEYLLSLVTADRATKSA